MAFLRTLFWIAVTVVVVVFSLHNWQTVTVNLFGNLQADVKLPALLLFMFLLGFLPLYLWHRAMRWQHARALTAERTPSAPTVPAAVAVPMAPGDRVAAPPTGVAPARAD